MKKKFFLGIMSGTSCDGLDICLASFSPKNKPFSYHVHETLFVPFSSRRRKDIDWFVKNTSPTDVHTVLERLLHIHYELGLHCVESISLFLKRKKISPGSVHAIGLHGQTLYHRSRSVRSCVIHAPHFGATLQAGEAGILAKKTGIPVVYDFRTADVLHGGEGAPLAPVVDRLLFRNEKKPVAILNIGGIANVTLLLPGNKILAMDTGPGNTLMDSFMRIKSSGRKHYDLDGRFARKGIVLSGLLKRWMAHPYLKKSPPRSTGREVFGDNFLRGFNLKKYNPEDVMRTLLEFSVETIASGIFNSSNTRPLRVLVSGGGAHNVFLMERLAQRFHPCPVSTVDEIGISSDFKEALIFACLAKLYCDGSLLRLKEITGNPVPTRLGKMVSP